MNRRDVKDLGASVRDRLLKRSRETRKEFQLVLTQYALDRLLNRLVRTPHRDEFVLKGALLVAAWGAGPYRVTRDVDLLKVGASEVAQVHDVFRLVCATAPDEDDGLDFDPDSVRAEIIREFSEYDGVRVRLTARLQRARIPLQVDIGFGDAMVPAAEVVELPVFLDLPATEIRAYSRETVVAEKFHAMVALGVANTRMKDFFDTWFLAMHFDFALGILASAIAATFERRQTHVPVETPIALTSEFHDDDDRRRQWSAFLARAAAEEGAPSLAEVSMLIWQFLEPVVSRVHDGRAAGGVDGTWPPGGAWGTKE